MPCRTPFGGMSNAFGAFKIPFNHDPKPIMGWSIMMIGRNVEYEALPNPVRRYVERIRHILNCFQALCLQMLNVKHGSAVHWQLLRATNSRFINENYVLHESCTYSLSDYVWVVQTLHPFIKYLGKRMSEHPRRNSQCLCVLPIRPQASCLCLLDFIHEVMSLSFAIY